MLLVLLRTDLIASWRAATPPDAPNRFVINLQPEQGAGVPRPRCATPACRSYDWFPMIRGRLVAINGKPVEPERIRRRPRAAPGRARVQPQPPGADAAAQHASSPAAGRADEADALSVEEGLAQTLELKLGDRLRFDIAGQVREGRITSAAQGRLGLDARQLLRHVPAARGWTTCRSATSARFARPDAPGFDNALARDFPNITNIDVSASIAQVQRVLDQVVRAVEFLFGFTLAAGLVVLFAAVSATREARAREFAVMRAMGAGSRLLAQVQRAELLGVGALAGLLAAVAAVVVGCALARYVFEFTWSASPWVPLVGAACGALLALAAGWMGLARRAAPAGDRDAAPRRRVIGCWWSACTRKTSTRCVPCVPVHSAT